MDNNATLVRRYAPPMPRRLVQVLALCPYDSPKWFAPQIRREPRKLAAWGLLEEDPQSPGWFRQTTAGQEVAQRWARLGFTVNPD